jgi:hypothetical protein
MNIINKPHSKYDHLYVVLRLSNSRSQSAVEGQPLDGIATVSVFSSKDAAEAEAERLNELNRDVAHYHVLVSRLKS